MEKLVIRVNEKPESTLRKPLMVSADLFEQIQTVAYETGYSKGALGDILVKFALQRLVIEDSKED